jgi:uncharacterized membrane protein YfcA
MITLSLFIVVICGLIIGTILGLTGAGGGMLAVPALIYTQGWTMQEAMPLALIAVSISAIIGAIDGFQKKLVRYKAAILMAFAGAPMTSLGVYVAHQMSQAFLLISFSVIVIIVMIRLSWQLRDKNLDNLDRITLARVNSQTGKFVWNAKTGAVLASIGGTTGFVTGMLGVGGGFIIVPMLRHFTNLSIHGAIATSLMVISLVGTSAITSALVQGATLPPLVTGFFIGSTIVGALIGRIISKHLPARQVQIVFILVLFGVAVSLLWKALG